MSQVQLNDDINSPLLEVNELRVEYGNGVKAVDDVSFQLERSELTSIVGESGSGKTSIARCIALLTKPASGSIRYNGSDISELKGKKLIEYRKQVQLVLQDPYSALNPRHDVLTIIATPIRELLGDKNDSSIADRVHRLLETVGLDPEITIGKFPHQLSGGERQRVNIARALAPEPKLIIADEPITMLDANQRLNILALLHLVKKTQNLTVLMITHDIASARTISNKLIVMYRGKIVEFGDMQEVVENPSHPYLELLMKSMPRLTQKEHEQDPNEQIPEKARSTTFLQLSRGCIFRASCRYAREACVERQPPLSRVSNGSSSPHYVACYFPLNSSTKKQI